jgi:Xaa-Pro aminopeptidase
MRNTTVLSSILSKQTLDALLISSVHNITYITEYEGFSPIEREAYLLLTTTDMFLFTDGRYTEAVRALPGINLREITTQTPFSTHLASLQETLGLHRIGFETDDLRVAEFAALKKLPAKFLPINTAVLRMIKNENEIQDIQHACRIGDQAFAHITHFIKRGITEKELALELEYFIKLHHADLSFPSIVAFGAHAATPHHQTGETRLKNNQFVLCDFGVKYKSYCSDMTRTLMYGAPTDEQKKIYRTVLGAQKAAINFINEQLKTNPNEIKLSAIDEQARQYIIAHDYPTIPHSLGHGIGIAVHEAPALSPKSQTLLQNGMVFSIEPGIYIPSFGGVRIEDIFTVQNNELVQLTKSPKELLTI